MPRDDLDASNSAAHSGLDSPETGGETSCSTTPSWLNNVKGPCSTPIVQQPLQATFLYGAATLQYRLCVLGCCIVPNPHTQKSAVHRSLLFAKQHGSVDPCLHCGYSWQRSWSTADCYCPTVSLRQPPGASSSCTAGCVLTAAHTCPT